MIFSRNSDAAPTAIIIAIVMVICTAAPWIQMLRYFDFQALMP
jgi:hypothetical protein